jgi:hypothetical protein
MRFGNYAENNKRDRMVCSAGWTTANQGSPKILADHAERVFLALGADAQGVLKPVIRQLVSIGLGEEIDSSSRDLFMVRLIQMEKCSSASHKSRSFGIGQGCALY